MGGEGGLGPRSTQSSLHPFKMAERKATQTVSRWRESKSQKRGVNVGGRTQTQDRHTQIHTHSGLNAYLLANLKDRFLKKQTNKKDK